MTAREACGSQTLESEYCSSSASTVSPHSLCFALQQRRSLRVALEPHHTCRWVSVRFTFLLGRWRVGSCGVHVAMRPTEPFIVCRSRRSPATLAGLNAPQAVVADGSGGVWIADTNNSVIRRLFANGTIVTWAGTGVAAYCTGPARSASCFSFPSGLASDGAGGLLVADTGNAVVRRISVNGTVSCEAGTPLVRSYSGDGGAATLATAGAVTGEHSLTAVSH